jgi:hypothetical protein
MLTQEDTTADELGVTDADVAQWDAIVARYKTHPEEFMSLEEFKKQMDEDIKRYREERRNKA